MTSVRINKELNDGIYFVTMTVKNWYYLFDRYGRWEILLDSLKYCQENKGLKVFAWVFMLNHIHLIVSSSDVSGFIRDFKKFTSKKLKESIYANEPNIIELFKNNNGDFHFWKETNMPELIETERFFNQKKKYIEDNPIKKFYVKNPEYWIYSSANSDNLLKITDIQELS